MPREQRDTALGKMQDPLLAAAMGGNIVYHPDNAPHVQIINGVSTIHGAAVVSDRLIYFEVPISRATLPQAMVSCVQLLTNRCEN